MLRDVPWAREVERLKRAAGELGIEVKLFAWRDWWS